MRSRVEQFLSRKCTDVSLNFIMNDYGAILFNCVRGTLFTLTADEFCLKRKEDSNLRFTPYGYFLTINSKIS